MTFLWTVVGIALLSVLMALWSLYKQTKMEELTHVRKKLKQKRVLYQRDS